MDVIGHDNPGIEIHSLVFTAKPPAIQHNIAVFIPGKKINPLYHRKGYKVNTLRIEEFIFAAHFFADNINCLQKVTMSIKRPYERKKRRIKLGLAQVVPTTSF